MERPLVGGSSGPTPPPTPPPPEDRAAFFRAIATDGDDEIAGVAALCDAHANVQGVELLPYHRFGEYKWKEMGVTYPMRGGRTPSRETIASVKRKFEARGVRVIV
jgi:pyruvate formate lyase activating enzyme